MKHAVLDQLGLSGPQIAVYEYLLSNGPTPPPKIGSKLKLTRTNAYKVLGQLVELGLISRTEVNKKFIYRAEDPIALASLVANERVRLIALEKNIKEALIELRKDYQNTADESDVQTFQGAEAIKSLYLRQAKLQESIYFVKTRSDIPFLGFETMDQIRKLAIKFGGQRYGIVPDAPEASRVPAIDRLVNLNKTWINSEDYTAPVEWTVCGDELMIISFSKKMSAIRIKNPLVADAFKQLWRVMDRGLRANPEYKKLPKKASRRV